MQELIDRIGITFFIQIVIELWNSVFLMLMIFSLIIKKPRAKQELTKNTARLVWI